MRKVDQIKRALDSKDDSEITRIVNVCSNAFSGDSLRKPVAREPREKRIHDICKNAMAMPGYERMLCLELNLPTNADDSSSSARRANRISAFAVVISIVAVLIAVFSSP